MPDNPFVVDSKPSSIAPGSAGFIVPPEQTFLTKFNQPWETYPRWADESIWDNPENARRMRNDPVLTNPMDVRVRASVLTTWHIEPDDDSSEAEVSAAAEIEWRIKQMPFLQSMLTTLLWEGIWAGRGADQIYYRWFSRKGISGIIPIGFDPVNGDKIIFGFGKNRGRVGIRVWAGYEGPKDLIDWGFVRWFDDKDRANLIIHRHNREDADFLQWQQSGKIQGVGLRDRIYWTWAMKNQALAFMMNYLQWFARGLTIYYYEKNNAAAFAEVQSRVTEHNKSGLPVLFFPRDLEGGPGFDPVQRMEPGSAGNNMIFNLVTQYFDDLFRRCILGQDATTVASGSSSLGDGRATLHQTTFDNIVKWDSNNLQDTLTQDLVKVMYAYTFPTITPGKWIFETEAPNVPQLIESAQMFTELGGQVDGSEMQKMLGLPVPKPGAQILGQQQSLQPTALGEMPTNTPVVTPPGQTSPGPVSQ